MKSLETKFFFLHRMSEMKHTMSAIQAYLKRKSLLLMAKVSIWDVLSKFRTYLNINMLPGITIRKRKDGKNDAETFRIFFFREFTETINLQLRN